MYAADERGDAADDRPVLQVDTVVYRSTAGDSTLAPRVRLLPQTSPFPLAGA